MNAITPNLICEELGRPRLTTPFGNLTQFEAILLNTQATAAIADQSAQKASDRAGQQQQEQMEQYQKMQQQNEPEGEQEGKQQAAAAPTTLKQPKAPAGPKKLKLVPPKPLKLPLMPMASSIYSCYQIAAMSVDQIKAAMTTGKMPPKAKQVKQNMQTQDPSILQQMEPGVVQYLDMLQQEQEKEESKTKVNITPQAIKDQRKKFKQQQHIPSDIERNLFPDNIRPGDVTPAYSSIRPTFADKRIKTTKGIKVTTNKPFTSDQIQRRQAGTNRGREISTTDVSKARRRGRLS